MSPATLLWDDDDDNTDQIEDYFNDDAFFDDDDEARIKAHDTAHEQNSYDDVDVDDDFHDAWTEPQDEEEDDQMYIDD